jgi:Spy/CpxP family protein refolding chaperone
MTLLKSLVLLIVGLAVAATPLHATTRAVDYPGSVAILLGIEGVRGDLGLTAQQKSRVNAIRKELRSSARAIVNAAQSGRKQELTTDQRLFALIDRNNAESLAVLTPAQLDRFHEVQNRILGYTMLVSPKVQKQLGLSAAQVRAVEAIRVRGLEFVAHANRLFEDGEIPNRKRLELLRNYRIEQAAQMKAVLTKPQEKAFSKLCGKPLKKG